MIEESRSERRSARRSRRAVALLAAALVLGIAAIAAGVWGAMRSQDPEPQPVALWTTTASTETTSADASETIAAIEVPSVGGLGIEQARIVLETAGLNVVMENSDQSAASGAERSVVEQDPPAGTLVEPDSTVTVFVELPPVSAKAAPAPKNRGWVVCIDPGHQTRGDSSPEPIGPGATEKKPSVTGGATGVVTKIPEYEIALQISMNLKKRLEAAGVTVVMTRTTNDVVISNSERAAVANKAGADLFVRVHGDGSPDKEAAGISTLYPASNKWTRGFAASSKRAAQLVQTDLIRATGAVDRGLSPRQDISGFNWAEVPSILVECGFLSNPVEDRLLASPHYQDKLAQGMTDGITRYLEQEAE